MSILSALNTGAGGLEANGLELSVVGDNIANASTVGFKASRAVFQDTLARTVIGAGPTQVGLGTRLQTVQRLVSQGTLANTSQPTDLALQGAGYFVVKGEYNGMDAQYYTRAGQFTVDKDGYMVNLSALRVQGYTADAAGVVGTSLGDLKIGNATSPPLATTTLSMRANLEANPAAVAAFSITDPTNTAHFNTSMVVYDSLGQEHQLDVYFRHDDANPGNWEWFALTDGGGQTGGTAGTPVQVANGTLSFGTDGELATFATTAQNFQPLNASAQTLTFNFGTPTAAAGTGLDGITQFASPSVATFLSQDGYASGELSSLTVDGKGQLVGAFSNGRSRVIGQVAVANFTSEGNLNRLGGNLFQQTETSGVPVVGTPGSGGHASISAGVLEQSNVDMGQEFIRLIAAQRGFQANAKTITTADQLLSELMTLKR
ncbi:MAG: flagellar hook protein FlgE [Myxococcales bacterium]|nr:flagellar hook protein FlgE [Myxococcales bacterium]